MSDEMNESDLDKRLLQEMYRNFLKEAEELLDQLNLNLIQLETEPTDEALLGDIFRNVHTLKGSASFVELHDISKVAGLMEEKIKEARQGAFTLSPSMIEIFYQGLDVLTSLLEQSSRQSGEELPDSGNFEASDIAIDPLASRLKAIPDAIPDAMSDISTETSEQKSDQNDLSDDFRELLNIYKQSYDQLAILKHIVYSSIHLTDPDSLATLFSKQIERHMSVERNAVWLVGRRNKAVEIARNGKAVATEQRRILDIESSEVLQRVVNEQLVVWPSSVPGVNDIFPKYQSPTLFPIKGRRRSYGFMILDPEEAAEMEVYQFIGQFAAMILKISKLHQQVEEQRAELDEMTAILFQQNTHLSSLYHVELELMTISDPIKVCRIVTDAIVNELEAKSAVAFLANTDGSQVEKASQSGNLEEIGNLKLSVNNDNIFSQAFQTGRMISYQAYPRTLDLGPNKMQNWIIFPFKGQERIQGILIVEVEDRDLSDPISILMNFSGIVLDNLNLKQKVIHVNP
ncbi:Hpt domain-containing protein [Desulfococcaceae bacterium HSG9]|nr:Hpt domain-containing protein [Desulfococcaceae bacterium HSG9]